jgi:hypothetical protein
MDTHARARTSISKRKVPMHMPAIKPLAEEAQSHALKKTTVAAKSFTSRMTHHASRITHQASRITHHASRITPAAVLFALGQATPNTKMTVMGGA